MRMPKSKRTEESLSDQMKKPSSWCWWYPLFHFLKAKLGISLGFHEASDAIFRLFSFVFLYHFLSLFSVFSFSFVKNNLSCKSALHMSSAAFEYVCPVVALFPLLSVRIFDMIMFLVNNEVLNELAKNCSMHWLSRKRKSVLIGCSMNICNVL